MDRNMSEEFNQNPQVEGENTGGGRLIQVDIDREMRKSFLDYSMSVIVDRHCLTFGTV